MTSIIKDKSSQSNEAYLEPSHSPRREDDVEDLDNSRSENFELLSRAISPVVPPQASINLNTQASRAQSIDPPAGPGDINTIIQRPSAMAMNNTPIHNGPPFDEFLEGGIHSRRNRRLFAQRARFRNGDPRHLQRRPDAPATAVSNDEYVYMEQSPFTVGVQPSLNAAFDERFRYQFLTARLHSRNLVRVLRETPPQILPCQYEVSTAPHTVDPNEIVMSPNTRERSEAVARAERLQRYARLHGYSAEVLNRNRPANTIPGPSGTSVATYPIEPVLSPWNTVTVGNNNPSVRIHPNQVAGTAISFQRYINRGARVRRQETVNQELTFASIENMRSRSINNDGAEYLRSEIPENQGLEEEENIPNTDVSNEGPFTIYPSAE
jgi:hypothetical protein